MGRPTIIVASMALYLAPPVTAGTVDPVSSGGMAQGIFRDAGPEEVAARIASACMDNKWVVIEQSTFTVLCERPGNENLETLRKLGGPRYSSPYRGFVRFSLSHMQGLTRVQASTWDESQNAFGRVDRVDGKGQAAVRYLLNSIGSTLPDGTTFKGNYLGINGTMIAYRDKQALKVDDVIPETAAASGGVAKGDLVIAVNGHKLGSAEDLKFYVNREKNIVRITIDRQGAISDLNLQALAHPAVGTPEYSRLVAMQRGDRW